MCKLAFITSKFVDVFLEDTSIMMGYVAVTLMTKSTLQFDIAVGRTLIGLHSCYVSS
jgi:hypothetical protein